MIRSLIDWLKRLLLGTARTLPGVSPFAPGEGPARLLIMRHAEKTGDKRDPHLSAAGQQRAEKLATYIPQTFGSPDFLIAAKSSKRSRRPVETLEPLADLLRLPVSEDLDDEQVDDLIDELRDTPAYAGKSGVISWRHSDIPALVAALGAPEGSYPAEWDEAVYNLLIEVTFREGAAPRARQITEPF
ncbi:MAG: phosphoglycerate mutase family protein [Hyphomicrobium sp.]